VSRCFRHEVSFYDGPGDFVDAILPFVRAGVDADEAVLVVVDRTKAAQLREALGDDHAAVEFADMGEVGRNPAWIIPAWLRFVEGAVASGRTPRGVGEPIVPARTADELRECHLHEALLNDVFDGGAPWSLRCPYDTMSLPDEVLVEAMRTHPLIEDEPTALQRVAATDMLRSTLPPPPVAAEELAFDRSALRRVRELALRVAADAGLGGRVDDVVVAVNELATNSTSHGGGRGVVRHWRDPADRALVVEVSDAGRIVDPLVGRLPPTVEQVGGRGVWMCNQVADLVQVASDEAGTTIRLRFGTAAG